MLPLGARVAMIGDSIVQAAAASSGADGKSLYNVDKGELVLAQALLPAFRCEVWNDPADARAGRHHGGALQGISGQEAWQMDDRFAADVLSLRPHAVVIAGGTNNLTSASAPRTVIASLRSMCEKALAAGARPVLTTIRPWASATPTGGSVSGNTATKREAFGPLNAAIRAYAASTGGAVALCDLAAAYGAPGDFAYAPVDYFSDGLHPVQKGAWAGAKALRDTLAGLIEPGHWFAAAHPRPAGILTEAQAHLSGGTGGGKAGAVTGTVPSGLNLWSGAASPSVAALLDNPATGGKSLALTVTAQGTANAETWPITLASNPNGAGALPDAHVMAWAEVEFDAWPAWAGAYLTLTQVPSVGRQAVAHKPIGNGTPHAAEPRRLLLATPPLRLDATATAVAPQIVVGARPNGATGTSGTVTVHRWWVGVVPDPRTVWTAA